MKSSNLRHSLAHSQNKGLSEYQRKASLLRTIPSPCRRQRGRWVTAWARRQGAILAPDMSSSNILWVASQLLPKSSWDPGWPTSARRVAARDQLPEETRGTSERVPLLHTQETEWLWPGRWLRCTAHLGQCTRQAPGHLSYSDLRRAQNTCPAEFVPLWSMWELEPEQLRPGKCMKPRACFGQFPCRPTWSLSSVDPESTHAMSQGKLSVVQTLPALPTHTSDICLKSSSLPTAQLNKWA